MLGIRFFISTAFPYFNCLICLPPTRVVVSIVASRMQRRCFPLRSEKIWDRPASRPARPPRLPNCVTSTRIALPGPPECERCTHRDSRMRAWCSFPTEILRHLQGLRKPFLQNASVALNSEPKSSTSTRIAKAISPQCERGAQF